MLWTCKQMWLDKQMWWDKQMWLDNPWKVGMASAAVENYALDTLVHRATRCTTLRHTTTHCTSKHYTATLNVSTTVARPLPPRPPSEISLLHTAPHCHTLQRAIERLHSWVCIVRISLFALAIEIIIFVYLSKWDMCKTDESAMEIAIWYCGKL